MPTHGVPLTHGDFQARCPKNTLLAKSESGGRLAPRALRLYGYREPRIRIRTASTAPRQWPRKAIGQLPVAEAGGLLLSRASAAGVCAGHRLPPQSLLCITEAISQRGGLDTDPTESFIRPRHSTLAAQSPCYSTPPGHGIRCWACRQPASHVCGQRQVLLTVGGGARRKRARPTVPV